jgi:hypothetical protein
MAAPTKDAPTDAEQLAIATARIKELEANQKPAAPASEAFAPAAAAAPPPMSAALKRDLEGGQSVVAEWLNKGCPACRAPIKTDTPVYEPTLPGLYPAILFHYGVFHDGVMPPKAPHGEDEAALDKPVIKGMMPNGSPRWVPYRQAITEAVAEWRAGVR